MVKIELKTKPAVKRIILAASPDYRKHNAFVSIFPDSGININSYWDGGSKDEYMIIHISSLTRKSLPTSTHPYFDVAAHGLANQATPDVESDHVGNLTLKRLPSGFALVRAGHFMGKPSTAHVYFSNDMEGAFELSKTVKALA